MNRNGNTPAEARTGPGSPHHPGPAAASGASAGSVPTAASGGSTASAANRNGTSVERPALDIRKREHVAFLLPVVGWLLIVPPLLILFGGHRWLFGIPLQTAYLFAVWVALIAGAALLSAFLPRARGDADTVGGAAGFPGSRASESPESVYSQPGVVPERVQRGESAERP